MLSVTSAFGPPVVAKVPPTCHSDPACGRGICFFCSSPSKSRFFVGRRGDLLRMTRFACGSHVLRSKVSACALSFEEKSRFLSPWRPLGMTVSKSSRAKKKLSLPGRPQRSPLQRNGLRLALRRPSIRTVARCSQLARLGFGQRNTQQDAAVSAQDANGCVYIA